MTMYQVEDENYELTDVSEATSVYAQENCDARRTDELLACFTFADGPDYVVVLRRRAAIDLARSILELEGRLQGVSAVTALALMDTPNLDLDLFHACPPAA